MFYLILISLNPKTIEGCGSKAFVVENMISDSKNRVFNSIQHHFSRGLVHGGVSLKYYQLESFLRENVIVESDNDGLAVLMPLKVYIKLTCSPHLVDGTCTKF